MSHQAVILVTDGSTWPVNPGNLRVGAAIIEKGETGEYLAHQLARDLKKRGTNSVAEFEALLAGLELAAEKRYKSLHVLVDSELVYKQVTGQYRVRASHLRPLRRQVLSLMKAFDRVEMSWHSRETPYARIADALSKGKAFSEGCTVYEALATLPAYDKPRAADTRKARRLAVNSEAFALLYG